MKEKNTIRYVLVSIDVHHHPMTYHEHWHFYDYEKHIISNGLTGHVVPQ